LTAAAIGVLTLAVLFVVPLARRFERTRRQREASEALAG